MRLLGALPGALLAAALQMGLAGCASAPRPVSLEPRPLGSGFESARAGGEAPPVEEPRGVLALRDAIAAALQMNPELAAFSWETRAREAEALQVGRPPNPDLSVELENVLGSGELEGLDAAETTVALSQLVELGGKRGARVTVASLEHDLAAWDYETSRLTVLTDVTRAFVTVLAAQRRVELAEDLVRVAEEILASVSRRVAAGAVSPVEESRARVELATSRIERDRSASELAITRRELAATWGSVSPEFTRAEGDLEPMTARPPLESLWQRIEQVPELARWTDELDLRRAEISLARSNRVPDVTVGAGIRHLADTSERALAFGLEIPLPLFDRGQGAIVAAESRLARADLERRASVVRIRTELARVYEALAVEEGEARALRDVILPEAVAAFRTSQGAYQQGLLSFTDVLDTQRRLFELRGRYFDTLAAYHGAVAEMERLLGEPLQPAAPMPVPPENRRP